MLLLLGTPVGGNSAVIPYHPSAMMGDLETVRTAVSAEKLEIDLAVCNKTKMIFFNHKNIKALVDLSIL
ncbi:MAG: hypothetical protein KAI50_11045 [Desulfobacterales bacterium]|nr:hypothetical protein [Desulfobacterales bacterium]